MIPSAHRGPDRVVVAGDAGERVKRGQRDGERGAVLRAELGDDGGHPGVTGGALLAGPTHVDDDRGITAGILRQNAQTSLKGASAICHRSDGAVPTRSA